MQGKILKKYLGKFVPKKQKRIDRMLEMTVLRQMWESMLHQTLHVRVATKTQKIQASDCTK